MPGRSGSRDIETAAQPDSTGLVRGETSTPSSTPASRAPGAACCSLPRASSPACSANGARAFCWTTGRASRWRCAIPRSPAGWWTSTAIRRSRKLCGRAIWSSPTAGRPSPCRCSRAASARCHPGQVRPSARDYQRGDGDRSAGGAPDGDLARRSAGARRRSAPGAAAEHADHGPGLAARPRPPNPAGRGRPWRGGVAGRRAGGGRLCRATRARRARQRRVGVVDASRSGPARRGLPSQDGFAVAAQLRESPIASDVPIIFISARGDLLARVRLLQLAHVDFVAKPFSGAESLTRIEQAFVATHARQMLAHRAAIDELTGLANLRMFQARLADEHARFARYGNPLALVMIDVDRSRQSTTGTATRRAAMPCAPSPTCCAARRGRPICPRATAATRWSSPPADYPRRGSGVRGAGARRGRPPRRQRKPANRQYRRRVVEPGEAASRPIASCSSGQITPATPPNAPAAIGCAPPRNLTRSPERRRRAIASMRVSGRGPLLRVSSG